MSDHSPHTPQYISIKGIVTYHYADAVRYAEQGGWSRYEWRHIAQISDLFGQRFDEMHIHGRRPNADPMFWNAIVTHMQTTLGHGWAGRVIYTDYRVPEVA